MRAYWAWRQGSYDRGYCGGKRRRASVTLRHQGISAPGEGLQGCLTTTPFISPPSETTLRNTVLFDHQPAARLLPAAACLAAACQPACTTAPLEPSAHRQCTSTSSSFSSSPSHTLSPRPSSPVSAGVAGHAHRHWGDEFTERAIIVRVVSLVMLFMSVIIAVWAGLNFQKRAIFLE